METRLASTADAPALAAMHGESFGAAAWKLEQVVSSLNLPTTKSWIVVANATAQGFILCQIVGVEVEILTICVSPNARHKGVGQQLLDTALDFARQNNAQRIFLEVATDNVIALLLYEKVGFQVTGRRKDYYNRGDQPIDAVTYSLDL
jgi:ribosomal-protein-alanine N-acetyltransferase